MSLRPRSPTFTSTISHDKSRSPDTVQKLSAKNEKSTTKTSKKVKRNDDNGGLSNSDYDLNSNNRRNRSCSNEKFINSSIDLCKTTGRKNSRNMSKEKKILKQRLLKFRENLQEKIKKNVNASENVKKTNVIDKNSSLTLNIDKESIKHLNKRNLIENFDIKAAKMKTRFKKPIYKTTDNAKIELEASYNPQTKEGDISFTEKSTGNIKSKKVKTELGRSKTFEDSQDVSYNFYPPNIRMKKNIHIKSKTKCKADFHNKTVDHQYYLQQSDKKNDKQGISVNLSKISNDTKRHSYFDVNMLNKNKDLEEKNNMTDINIYNSLKKNKISRENKNEIENSDESELKMSDMEIFHAAAIFIQKHIRGFLIRAKLLNAYEDYLVQYELGNVSHED